MKFLFVLVQLGVAVVRE